MATLLLNMNTEIKPFLDAMDASPDDEVFLEQMEANMISVIEGDTGWRFLEGAAGEAFTIEGKGGTRLWLPYRAMSITSVEVRYTLSSAWETVASTAYELSGSRASILLVDGTLWPEGDALVRVTGQFGYAAADVPRKVRNLVLETMNWMYRRGRKVFNDHEVFVRMKTETNFDLILREYRKPNYG